MTRVLVSDLVKREFASRLNAAAPDLEIVGLDKEGQVDGPDDSFDAVFLSPDMFFGAARHLFQYLERPVKWFHTSSAGVDHPAFRQVMERGVRLSNGGGTQAKPIAQWTLMFMLAAAKGLRPWLDRQELKEWKAHESDELTGRVCGIIGLGAIGLEIARLSKAFEMQTVGVRRSPAAAANVDRVLPLGALDDLLEASDFVVVAAPLNEQSRHMLGEREFGLMKRSAWLINVGRGAIIREDELVKALEAGEIAGAALDVFEKEPLPEDSPLWSLPNVYVTPHNSGSSPYSLERAVEVFARNLEQFVADGSLITEVTAKDLVSQAG
ncbi:MAG TPA: D-2-hydroxyacid dehydrogenase [Dehalococcoidia bacterium]|nr:D-2-hydroxyacid dehydrogenase [Dehalococcoidia bacterium]